MEKILLVRKCSQCRQEGCNKGKATCPVNIDKASSSTSSTSGGDIDAQTITITFGDRAENHTGMQSIGESAIEGYSHDDLFKMSQWFSSKQFDSQIYDLTYNLNTDSEADSEADLQSIEKTPEAYILIVKNGVNAFCDSADLFTELKNLNWDTKALMRGRVVNKHARHNLCFSEFSQESDFENGRGTIVNLDLVPHLKSIKNGLSEIHSKNIDLQIEGNNYYDISKCGIGFHGDSERKKVIGIRLGASMPIVFQWYYKFQSISHKFKFNLESGDLYVMCSKAVGTDWKRSSIYTLRHAAGCEKYIK
jgi:hypothetical protein